MNQYAFKVGQLVPVRGDFIKKHSSVMTMTATEEHIFVLYNDKSLEVLKASNNEEVVTKTT